MKRIESKPEDHNIYCTAADSAEHSLLSLSATALLSQVKLCSILGKHVYLSVSHIYENPEAAALLIQNPDLLVSGMIAIGLRSDCRDFSDFIEMRESEGRHISSKDQELTRFLNSNTEAVITWTPSDMQPDFKKAIQESLADPQSTLRKRLTATRKKDISELAAVIADMPYNKATRTNMELVAEKYIPRGAHAFKRETNLLYYVMGSKDKHLVPHLQSRLFTDLAGGYKQSSATPAAAQPLDEWLDETLHHTLFPAKALDTLTITQIAEFRRDFGDQVERFRSKWWRIVPTGLGTDTITELKTETNALRSLLREVQNEMSKVVRYDKAVKAGNVSSLLISAATLFSNPVLAALSFLISVGTYAASNDNVKYRILGTDFIALTSSLSMFARAKSAEE